jgi:hypothetical protein
LSDHGSTADLTPEQIGLTWLNYIVEDRSILWWGGLGNSTEHTAFLRLKSGIPAPASGAIQTNGKTVAEQIGAQIFIDGWALVSPGNPRLAVELAQKAASVSHDGEAIYAARLLAAMEAQAFIEPRIDQLIETGLSYIPPDCVITRLVDDVRDWNHTDGNWRVTRERIEKRYGYDKFPGNCHIIPNHAIIILSLLYSEDDFSRALMIANTAGWDTDCNSGNVGCLIGFIFPPPTAAVVSRTRSARPMRFVGLPTNLGRWSRCRYRNTVPVFILSFQGHSKDSRLNRVTAPLS